MEWEPWWHANRHIIESQGSPYAVLFARKVLPMVEGIEVATVKAEQWIGTSRRADFVIDEGGLVKIAIEVDSHEHHDPNQLDDREKDIELRRHGWSVLRFLTEQFGYTPVYNNPPLAKAAGAKKCAESIALELRKLRDAESRLSELPELKLALRERNTLLAAANQRIDQLETKLRASPSAAATHTDDTEATPSDTADLVLYEPTLAPAIAERNAIAAQRDELIESIIREVFSYEERRRFTELEENHQRELRQLVDLAAEQNRVNDARLAALEQKRRPVSRFAIVVGLLATLGVLTAGIVAWTFLSNNGSSDSKVRLELASMTNTVRVGEKASVVASTDAGSACVITYYTPRGTVSNASGLDPKTASNDGRVSWEWTIGSSTQPGSGHVEVNCGGRHEQWPLTITE